MITFVEKFIPVESQDIIQKYLLSKAIDWHYLNYATYDGANTEVTDPKIGKLLGMDGFYDYHQLSHLFYSVDIGTEGDSMLNEIFPLILPAFTEETILLSKQLFLHNLRANMTFPLRDCAVNSASLPHIDRYRTGDQKIFTAIYYVNDSDGDTIIYKDSFNDDIPDKLTEYKRIKPEKGKLVIFDGYQIHTGCLPSSGRRVILNINFGII
jgi:hypothetical protein